MVDLVRSGRTPEELAREIVHLGEASRPIDGPTSAEREELTRLRRENHRLASGARRPGKGGSLVREGKASSNGFTGS
jgi:transposase